MVTAGEYRIARIVAVWRDEQGRSHVLPPWGAAVSSSARSKGNLAAEVVLGVDRSVPKRGLLPPWEWPEPLTEP